MRKALSILALIYMLTAIHAVYAGPNVDELQAFRALVPTHSKTSGGSSPALSPDGRTLAYLRNGECWILRWLGDPKSDIPPYGSALDPWAIELPPLPLSKDYAPIADSEYYKGRNIDWSPDGERLVFVAKDRLYIAENFGPNMSSAQVRLLADLRTKDDPIPPVPGTSETREQAQKRSTDQQLPFHSPRWSPDGKKIAVIRPYCWGLPAIVSIIDPDTGEEQQISAEAMPDPRVWEQPWSPDSRSLAFASMEKSVKQAGWTYYGGISVVAANGKGVQRVLPQKYNFFPYPSWCPTADQIAFSHPDHDVEIVFPNGTALKLEQPTYSIFTAKSDGTNIKQITHYPGIQKIYKLSGAETGRQVKEVFDTYYKAEITTGELKQFETKKAIAADFTDMIELAAIRIAAKSTNEEFRKQIESIIALKGASIKEKLAKAKKLAEGLKLHNADPYSNEKYKWQDRLSRSIILQTYRQSIAPVWSPDGKKLAFIRQTANDTKYLMLMDLATGRESKLFEAGYTMACVSWTRDSKGIVVETGDQTGYSRPANHHFLGYPEIWYLEPK